MAKKCPDSQLLSVYFDGELSSPWKEKLEDHISNCVACRQKLEEYHGISLAYSVEEEMVLKAAKEKVWDRLQDHSVLPFVMPQRSIWRSRISIPIPAAAAIVILFGLFVFLAFRTRSSQEVPNSMILASETEFDIPDVIPITNIEDVLLYLSSRDNGDILRLPETRNFVDFRQPSIIKASDYSRPNNYRWRNP